MIIAQDDSNIEAINDIVTAIVLPPVFRTRSLISWRLLILWETLPRRLYLQHIQPILPQLNNHDVLTPGYEFFFQLQAVYEHRRVHKEGTPRTLSTPMQRETTGPRRTYAAVIQEVEEPNMETETRSEPQTTAPTPPSLTMDDIHKQKPTPTQLNPFRLATMAGGRGGRRGDRLHSPQVSTISSLSSPDMMVRAHTTPTMAPSTSQTISISDRTSFETYIQQQVSQAMAKQAETQALHLAQLRDSLLLTMSTRINDAHSNFTRQTIIQRAEALNCQILKLKREKLKLGTLQRKLGRPGENMEELQEECSQLAESIREAETRIITVRRNILTDADTNQIPQAELEILDFH